jgi:hypothetical protein
LRLDISNNQLVGVKGTKGKLKSNGWAGKSFAADWGEKDNHWEWIPDCSGVRALANTIKDNGAISTLTFGDKQVVTMTTKMTEANFSGKLYSSDAQIVAAFLPKCT